MSGNEIVVYGATGLTGGRVCGALDTADVPFVVAGRDRFALEKLAEVVGAADVRAATVDDPAALARAFRDASVVVNCAGPLADVAEPVLAAALAAGAHYVDLGGDQRTVHALYEQQDAAARRAGRAVIPACALNCAIGDWAAAWAAAYVCGVADERGESAGGGDRGGFAGAAGGSAPRGNDDGDAVRSEPAPRLAEDRPLDEICVSYIFDDLVLSPASQKAVFGAIHERGLVWRRDRWESVAPGAERRRVNAGAETGGERDCVSFPGGDVITVPRHVCARSVQTFISTTRSAVATTALRWLARAMPLVPKRATDALVAYQPSQDDYARTRFAVVAQARRGFSAAQVVVRGVDQYRASAGVAAWVARQLAARTTGPVGMRAPSEVFRPARALAAVAEDVGLVVEPSFR